MCRQDHTIWSFMEIAYNKKELSALLKNRENIGLVPTMGALHVGHVSLIEESVRRKLFTVASIFVNPTQFNNASDFEKYPIDTEADLEKLKKAGCDLVFLPKKEELYLKGKGQEKYIHDFGKLDSTIEGEYRPGHFVGVGQVVHILFECIKPSVAFFGQKDFQQLQVIKLLNQKINAGIDVVGMPTIRESDGLAMSSRNRRLNPEQREAASLIFKALSFAKAKHGDLTSGELKEAVTQLFDTERLLELEYFEIINPYDFEPINGRIQEPAHAVIAAFAGEVRLIDNYHLI